MFDSQRALYKEGLGYTPKKGKAAFAPHKTSFVKNNGRFCISCKQVGVFINDLHEPSAHVLEDLTSLRLNLDQALGDSSALTRFNPDQVLEGSALTFLSQHRQATPP